MWIARRRGLKQAILALAHHLVAAPRYRAGSLDLARLKLTRRQSNALELQERAGMTR